MSPTIGALCARYLADYPDTCGTKRAILKRLQDDPIGKIEAPGTPKDYVDFCRRRRADVAPASVNIEVIYLRGVLQYAKAGWGMAHVTAKPLREAMPLLTKQGLIGSSRRRERTPTPDEAKTVVEYLRAEGKELMADTIDFQYRSSRRISETVRLMWGDLDKDKKIILVRDMKHPRHKAGNDRLVALPNEAFDIIMRQRRMTDKPDERIFKVYAETIKRVFRTTCRKLGYQDLHLHDLRRGTVTRLLEEGRSVPEVMLVTGQVTVGMVLTTYNGMKAEDFHKQRAA